MNATVRPCSRCGKPLTHTPYELWLFHCCRSCYAENTTRKWSNGYGTERKWRYFPRWHLTEHPDLPEERRARYA